MSLAIANTSIRQFDGLYSLNDLHKASGSNRNHQPSNWLRLDQTQALIEEITKSSDLRSLAINVQTGRNGGTYVCKELVVAYAAWISAKFHLKVIRVFLNNTTSTSSLSPTALDNARKQLIEAVWNKGGVRVDWSEIMPDEQAALGLLASVLMSSRWTLYFDPNSMIPRLHPIPENARLLTPANIIEQFSDLHFSPEQTHALLNKCSDRLYRNQKTRRPS